MKNIGLFLFLFCAVNLVAQNSVTWVGGTPGKETKWNEPRNWDRNRVPDEDSHVIIKLKNSGNLVQPILQTETTVASIEIQANAALTVAPKGKLTIDGEYTYSNGISIFGGKLLSKGEIIVKNIDLDFLNYSESVVLLKKSVYYSEQHDYEFSVIY